MTIVGYSLRNKAGSAIPPPEIADPVIFYVFFGFFTLFPERKCDHYTRLTPERCFSSPWIQSDLSNTMISRILLSDQVIG